jgi:small subunit ribosomal protein S7
MRHAKVTKREVAPDKIYNSTLVAKVINRMMIDGKKTVAERKFYAALKLLETQGKNPLEQFELALQNIGPKIEVKARRVGGANYQVPQEVKTERRTSLAIRWLVEAANKRSNKEFKTFEEKLVAEITDATQNQGEAVRKRETMARQADANKAFASFRW